MEKLANNKLLLEIDKKILLEMDINSHQSLVELARKLNRTKEAIGYRIKGLIDKKILLRCHAIVDMSKFGYETFRVYIKWQNMTLREKDQFYSFLSDIPNIWTVAKLHDVWDIAFFLGCKKTTEFQETWNHIEENYKHKILEYKIAIYSPIHNFNKRFLDPTFQRVITRTTGTHQTAEHDELDLKILQIYGQDVRQSLLTIAKKCGVSIETVRKRIKRLEIEEVIAGYKVDIDLAVIGFQGYRVDFYLNSIKRNKELFEYLKQHPSFYQINESIGGADFETEIVVKDLIQLLSILEEVTQRFKDVIRYYQYFGYTGFPMLSMIAD